MSATVIIPTTGEGEVHYAIESVLDQTLKTKIYLVCDGEKFRPKVEKILEDYVIPGEEEQIKVCYLPLNVGANGFYGHRIYAAFTHLIDTDYVLYLDQDNWYETNHVASCISTIETYNLDWCYSLRNIYNKSAEFECRDDCESLGKWTPYTNYNHIDTNCYCIKTPIAIKLASVWHGGWGQDRVFLSAISQHFTNYDCTGDYTVNYRLDGNPGSVTADFFKSGNNVVNEKYNGDFPWNHKKTL